jgi:hypothetical protein
MKAVGNHLVLTFCMIRPATNDLFSIVLSRKPMQLTVDVSERNLIHETLFKSYNFQDIQSVRDLLTRRGLSVNRYRKVCQNGAMAQASLSLLSVIAAVIVGYKQILCYN